MREVTVEGVKYQVIATPPWVGIVAERIADKLKKLQNKGVSDVEVLKISAELKPLIVLVVDECCTPKPMPGHVTLLYNAVNEETLAVLKEADFFREFTNPNVDQGGAVGQAASAASKRGSAASG